jgi:hypothetical protein
VRSQPAQALAGAPHARPGRARHPLVRLVREEQDQHQHLDQERQHAADEELHRLPPALSSSLGVTGRPWRRGDKVATRGFTGREHAGGARLLP